MTRKEHFDDLETESLHTDETRINTPVLNNDIASHQNELPTVIRTEGSQWMGVQTTDNVENEGDMNLLYYDEAGHLAGSMEFHIHGDLAEDGTRSHWKIYTLDGTLEDGVRKPRFQIGSGDANVTATFENTDEVRIDPDGSSTLLFLRASEGYSNNIEFREGSQVHYRIRRVEDSFRLENPEWGDDHIRTYSNGELRLNGHVLSLRADGSTFWEYNWDGVIDQHQTPTTGVVWDSGSSRPSDPVEGQRYFDSSLGQPIWYDGSGWVDALGDTV